MTAKWAINSDIYTVAFLFTLYDICGKIVQGGWNRRGIR